MIPWEDHVVASIDGSEGRELLFEGVLHEVLRHLRGTSVTDRQRMLLSFPDRVRPPTRYDGIEIGGLLVALQLRGNPLGRQR